MTIPTALAPTAKLATPRVKKFVEGLLDLFGPPAQLAGFFLCSPGVHAVRQGEEEWIEADWGADIIAERFNLADLEAARRKSKTVHIGDVTVSNLWR